MIEPPWWTQASNVGWIFKALGAAVAGLAAWRAGRPPKNPTGTPGTLAVSPEFADFTREIFERIPDIVR